jgi:hypothetical protein
MPTECSADLFGFAPVEGRQVVAGFDGGTITFDAGERWCTEVGKLTVSPATCSGYATRTEIGLVTRIIRLSASTAIAISPC